MMEKLDIRTVLWNQSSEHHGKYKSIDDIFYMIEVSHETTMAASAPFRIDMGLILVCEEGEGEVGIDMVRCKISKGGMMIVFPGQIVEQYGFSDDFKGRLMMYSIDFFSHINFPVSFPLVIFDVEAPVMHLRDKQLVIVSSICDAIVSVCDSDIPNKKEVFKYLCISMIVSFKIELQKYAESDGISNKVISKKFMRLLTGNFSRHHDIQFYADKMNLTKKYFSVVIKNETGRTASEWIDEFLILEAKKLLATTDMTIQQISIELNFVNQSFFGKFFKRITGMSPKEYKKSLM